MGKDKITYTNGVQYASEGAFGQHVPSHDNHGNHAFGPTIVCSTGEHINRAKDEWRSDIRAIHAVEEPEGILSNLLDGFSVSLGNNLQSPLQHRCNTARAASKAR